MNYRLETVAIDVLLVRLFDQIDQANMPWLLAATQRLRSVFSGQLIDLVPSYTTLMLHYDMALLDERTARALIQSALQDVRPEQTDSTGTRHELPVWYDPSVGPDLQRLAQLRGVGQEAIIQTHSGRDYRVFALGFAPGFAYLGLLDPALVAPRLATPRQRVPAGSVGVAEHQTAIYPMASPGGWNLLGRTAIQLFDRHQEHASLLKPGDSVRFVPVSRDEFMRQGGDDTPVEADA